MKIESSSQDDLPENHGDIDVYQHEGPEVQHVVDPPTPLFDRRGEALLPSHTHHDGQHHDIYQRGYRSLIGADKPTAVHPFPQQKDEGDDAEESCQHKAVDGPSEHIPIHRADAQLQQQSHNHQAASDEETLFHSIRLSPHGLSQFLLQRYG